MIGHPLLSFTSGSQVVITPVAPTVEVGHSGGRKKRQVIIDDVIYLGTDEQIEAKLWEIVQSRRPEKKQIPKKKAKKAKPVELKQDYVPIPLQIDMPRFQQLVADTYRHEDAFQRAMLQRMIEMYLDEEDAEILLLYG